MPQNTACERCQRIGFVRLEHIITGTKVTLAYYCGACDHSWQMVVPDPRQPLTASLRAQKDRRESA